jgi:hypothetical protein
MSTVKTTNIQHADAAAVGILLAADGTVGGLRPTQNTQSGTAYTLELTDSGRTVTLSNAAAVTVTVPAQATVAWNAGEMVSLLNLGVGTVTVVAAAGVTINGTPLTLATSKGGSLVRTASNVWTFIPFSAGVEAANFTNEATGTYTDSGIDYKYLTVTGSGSITIDRAGLADILVIGAGAGGLQCGGGGGQYLNTSLQLPEGVTTITIGAGGAAGVGGSSRASNGGKTTFANSLGTLIAIGGGGGADNNTAIRQAGNGACGGGFYQVSSSNGNDFGRGFAHFNGGMSVSTLHSGGGGAGGVGANGGGTGGAGGIGLFSSITGSSVGRCGGGGGGANGTGGTATSGGGAGGNAGAGGTAGTANTGGGGGGGGWSAVSPKAGGSGVVIVRVVV